MFGRKKKQEEDPLSGTMGHLSETQTHCLNEFREWSASQYKAILDDDPFIDDYYYLRFLRARKFDMDLSKKMFSDHMAWRQEKDTKALMNFDFHEKKNVFPHYKRGYHKTDKLGRPIYFERGGRLDVTKVWENTTEERMMMQFIQDYELLTRLYLPVCSEIKGERVDQVFTVLDCDGFTMSMMTKQVYNLLKIASGITQDNYPELMGGSMIINSPLMFRGVWAIVSKFLDEKTQKKFQILKTDYQTELFKVADKENLPSFVGGTSYADLGDNVLIDNIGPWKDYECIRSTGKIQKKQAAITNEPQQDEGKQEQEEESKTN